MLDWAKEHWWEIIQNTIAAAGLLFGLFQWFYNNKVEFYLFWVRLRSRIRDTIWEVAATYETEREDDLLSRIELVLKRQFGLKALPIEMNTPVKRIYTLGSYIISVEDNRDTVEDLRQTELFLRVRRLNVTLGMARKRLAELEDVFSAIQEVLKPSTVVYNLDLYFPGSNPFYGLLIQRLGTDNVKDFLCVVDTKGLDKDLDATVGERKALISKEKVSLTHIRFHALRQVAETFLLLK